MLVIIYAEKMTKTHNIIRNLEQQYRNRKEIGGCLGLGVDGSGAWGFFFGVMKMF